MLILKKKYNSSKELVPKPPLYIFARSLYILSERIFRKALIFYKVTRSFRLFIHFRVVRLRLVNTLNPSRDERLNQVQM